MTVVQASHFFGFVTILHLLGSDVAMNLVITKAVADASCDMSAVRPGRVACEMKELPETIGHYLIQSVTVVELGVMMYCYCLLWVVTSSELW